MVYRTVYFVFVVQRVNTAQATSLAVNQILCSMPFLNCRVYAIEKAVRFLYSRMYVFEGVLCVEGDVFHWLYISLLM